MTVSSKLRKGLSSGGGDAGPNVADVFSTYLYDGNGGTQTITNGIDLAGEGGLVWMKVRNNAWSRHELVNTERGSGKSLETSDAAAERGFSGLSSFNSDGFTLNNASGQVNSSGDNRYVSWTFKKAPRFFDIQEFTTTYNASPNIIPTDLECTIGMAIFKQLDSTGQGENWIVYHRGLGLNKYIRLNDTAAAISDSQSFNAVNYWDGVTLGYPMSNSSDRLVSGSTETTNWIGYFFAHDPDGENGDDGMIACGSVTLSGMTSVSLGWEAQYVLCKPTSAGNWVIFDNMRGVVTGGEDAQLRPNSYSAEVVDGERAEFNSDGFSLNGSELGNTEYIYMAIRAPMMVEPESGTEVFTTSSLIEWVIQYGSDPNMVADHRVDMGIYRRDVNETGAWISHETHSRLTGDRDLDLITNAAEVTSGRLMRWDFNKGYRPTNYQSNRWNYRSWMFKRAKGVFDVVAYTGKGGGSTIDHSLGVAPEMVISRARNNSENWNATWVDFNSTLSNDRVYIFNDTGWWNGALFSSYGDESLTASGNTVANTSKDYILYLFASLAGVSKVGSYLGNGSSLSVDCGFTNGARFVLIRAADKTGAQPDYGNFMWDSERGIVAGTEPSLRLDTITMEQHDDSIDPLSSGFIVNQTSNTNVNNSGINYVFLAIA
jgi:hypothetical protein